VRKASCSYGRWRPRRRVTLDIQFLVERLESLVVNARKSDDEPSHPRASGDLDVTISCASRSPRGASGAAHQSRERSRALEGPRGSEQIIGASQEQAALLLQDQAILREAELKAQELLDKAQAKAAETMSGADQYAADVLVAPRERPREVALHHQEKSRGHRGAEAAADRGVIT